MYSAEVIESSKDLTAKERIKFKNTQDTVKIDEASQRGEVIITPDYYVVIKVHNDKGDTPEYHTYLIIDKDGTVYSTSSSNFFATFYDMFTEMAETNEEYSLKIIRKESKNYKGKEFITCEII